MSNRYLERGVSAIKEDVHNAIKNEKKGLFENTFCKIIPDIVSGDLDYCNIMHADGAGTKSILAYLYWKETGDISIWKGIAQDALIMNIDDMICVGACNNFVMSSTIGRNKHLIPGDVITEIIRGNNEVINTLKKYDINIYSSGGETADVGDITKTIIVDSTVFAREKRENIIEFNLKNNDVIIGLSSSGKSKYEKEFNSGIGSNGLTSARHDILNNIYSKKYPETYSEETPKDLVYCGNHLLTDKHQLHKNMGKMLLSPTRTYSPIIKKVLEKHRNNISGIIHCTGGGQTKILNFINSLHIIKDNLFDIPPIFKLIQNESATDPKEMYKVFNMGHRMEIYTDSNTANKIIEISNSYSIDAQVIGKVQSSDTKKLSIISELGNFEY